MEFERHDGVGSGAASNSTLLKQLKQLSDASATVQFSKVDSEGSEYVLVILVEEKPEVEAAACQVNEVTNPSRSQKTANTSKCRRSQG